MGLAGSGARVGDNIVLCQGSTVPLVFRSVGGERKLGTIMCSEGGGETAKWQLVADAYVHGIMGGEKFDEGRCKKMILI